MYKIIKSHCIRLLFVIIIKVTVMLLRQKIAFVFLSVSAQRNGKRPEIYSTTAETKHQKRRNKMECDFARPVQLPCGR
jgi:dolichyl-phosphate-mannose--protein O-mannosyl transferase